MSEEIQLGNDADLRVMQFMTEDELERFTGILETLEKENAWYANFASDPQRPLTDEERAAWFAHMARWERAMDAKTDLISKYADECEAFAKLVDYSLEAIEHLFALGKFDSVTKLSEFWRLVYQRILSTRAADIKADKSFRRVQILRVLNEQCTELLPGFAEIHFRQKRDNPVLAQFLESLT
jgi:hypothetical protein